MEHAVYLCSWSQSKSGFKLWVISRPRIRSEAPTYAEAEALLIRAIQDSGGAMHAVMEFDPPLPKSEIEVKYATPEIFRIVGDDRFEADLGEWIPHIDNDPIEFEKHLKEIDSYYQQPVCRSCKNASSKRSDKPLELTAGPEPGYDGAFGHIGRGKTTIEILSEGFLKLLTPAELELLELRPVIRSRGSRKKFYELLGPAGPPLVAVAGKKVKGWRCSSCQYRTWGYWEKNDTIRDFIAATDVPHSLGGVFTIGIPPEVHLATTPARWKELVGRKGTRGFTSSLIGVVPDNEVVRIPELKTLEECLSEIPATW